MKQGFSRRVRPWLLAGLVMSATAAQAAWTEATTRHFVVLSEDKPDDVRRFGEKLERFDQAMRNVNRLGDADLGPSNRLTVYVVRNIGVVQRLASPKLIGFYLARSGGSLAVVPQYDVYSPTLAQSVLFHEYAHHVLLSNYLAAWPLWLSEGLAEFYATAATQDDGSVRIGLPPVDRAYDLLGTQQTVLSSRVQTRLARPTLKQLLSNTRETVGNPQLYARGWLLVHHLNFEPQRTGQLNRYVAALERGIGSVEAGTAAFGELAALDGDLDGYLKKSRFKYLQVPASQIKVDAISLRTLSAAEQELMPHRIRSKTHDGDIDPKEAQALASSVKALAARFPNDALVQASLAQAELDAGNHTAAEGAADRAIAIDPTLVEAHLGKALAQMAIARSARSSDPQVWSEIRKTLVAANRLDPDNSQPLALFYQTFSASGQSPNANAVTGLHQARELAPQVGELQLMSAYQYLVDSQLEQARKALTRYAYRPHAQGTADKAIAVLEVLDEKGTAAALETFVASGLKSW